MSRMRAGDSETRIREAAHEWRTRMSEPDASEAEQRRFEAWRGADPRHAAAYERALAVYAALRGLNRADYDPEFFKPLWRERVLAGLRGFSAIFLHGKSGLATGATVLAALTCAVLIVPRFMEDPRPVAEAAPLVARHATGTGETRRVTLADGTAVTIGARSEIEMTYTDSARNVRLLAGAALFEVAADRRRPFSVQAGDLGARALGTQFDVRNNAGVYRVAVAEGKVQVSFPHRIGGRATGMMLRRELGAGWQLTAQAATGLAPSRPIEPGQVGAWRNKRLVYEGASIAELIADANRYNDRAVVIAEGSEDIASLTLTGSFSGDHIERMLMTLADIHPVTVDTRDPAVIRLRRRDPGR